MKNAYLFFIATAFLGLSAAAGGNVAFSIKVDGIKASNKAPNHPEYQSLELTGTVVQSDAFVKNMPQVLPEKLSLLFKLDNTADKFLAKFCAKAAVAAKKHGKDIRIDIFMNEPNDLPGLIEGGMTDNRFNSFVVRTDDIRVTSVSCSIK